MLYNRGHLYIAACFLMQIGFLYWDIKWIVDTYQVHQFLLGFPIVQIFLSLHKVYLPLQLSISQQSSYTQKPLTETNQNNQYQAHLPIFLQIQTKFSCNAIYLCLESINLF